MSQIRQSNDSGGHSLPRLLPHSPLHTLESVLTQLVKTTTSTTLPYKQIQSLAKSSVLPEALVNTSTSQIWDRLVLLHAVSTFLAARLQFHANKERRIVFLFSLSMCFSHLGEHKTYPEQ